MLPTLSVVIPNYNHGHYLERCLFSVMHQERLPDEVIVYDDGSTDNSLEVLAELQKRWPLVRVVVGGTNAGVLAALAAVGKEARGQWLHCLAADDMPLPGFYRLALREIACHPDVAVVFGGYQAVESNGDRWMETADRWIDPGYLSPKEMLWKLFNKAPALFGLSFATLWNHAYFKKMLSKHHEMGSYWDAFVFRCLSVQHGGIYLGSTPLVCIRTAAESFCGQARTDTQNYFALQKNVAATMRQHYTHIFPPKYIECWEQKMAEELSINTMATHRYVKLAVAWAARELAKRITRTLGR